MDVERTEYSQANEALYSKLTGLLVEHLGKLHDPETVKPVSIAFEDTYTESETFLTLDEFGVWRLDNGEEIQVIPGDFESVLRHFTRITDEPYQRFESEWRSRCRQKLYDSFITESMIRRVNISLYASRLEPLEREEIIGNRKLVSEEELRNLESFFGANWLAEENRFFERENTRITQRFFTVLAQIGKNLANDEMVDNGDVAIVELE